MPEAVMAPILPVVYADYRRHLRTGDLLLSRACSMEGQVIANLSGSPYSHATMIGWAGRIPHRVLMMGETREHFSARAIALSREIRRWPGFYDVFRLRPEVDWNPDKAWAFVCRAAGTDYSWRHITRGGLRRLFCSLIPPIPNSDDPEWPRACSSLVHAALRSARGPQLREHDCDVSPGDLADPRFFEYQATLVFTEEQLLAFQSDLVTQGV